MTDEPIVIVQLDDWEGLYVNGFLKEDGHSIDVFNIVEAMKTIEGAVIPSYRYVTCPSYVIRKNGSMPTDLSDVLKMSKGIYVEDLGDEGVRIYRDGEFVARLDRVCYDIVKESLSK